MCCRCFQSFIPTASTSVFAAESLFMLHSQAGLFPFHPRGRSQSPSHIPALLGCSETPPSSQPAENHPSSFSLQSLGVESAICTAFQDNYRIFLTLVLGALMLRCFEPWLSHPQPTVKVWMAFKALPTQPPPWFHYSAPANSVFIPGDFIPSVPQPPVQAQEQGGLSWHIPRAPRSPDVPWALSPGPALLRGPPALPGSSTPGKKKSLSQSQLPAVPSEQLQV